MPRKGWSDPPLEWVQIVRGRRPISEQWLLAPCHSQNRSGQSSQQRQTGSGGAKRVSTPPSLQRPATVVRERKTPEQVRSDASTKVSRLQALNSLGVGDVEEKRALESALLKAQKQAEEVPSARQIEVTKDFIARAKKRMMVADEKIRLAQVAVQDAKDEKDSDMREVPLAEARLERLQKEVVPLRQTPPVSSVSDLEAEVQRLRSQLAKREVTNAECGCHSPQSSTQGCQTACWSVRTNSSRPAKPPVLHVRQVSGVAGCDPVWVSGIDPLVDRSHPQWGGTEPDFPVHGHQCGVCVRNISHRCGLQGVSRR